MLAYEQALIKQVLTIANTVKVSTNMSGATVKYDMYAQTIWHVSIISVLGCLLTAVSIFI